MCLCTICVAIFFSASVSRQQIIERVEAWRRKRNLFCGGIYLLLVFKKKKNIKRKREEEKSRWNLREEKWKKKKLYIFILRKNSISDPERWWKKIFFSFQHIYKFIWAVKFGQLESQTTNSLPAFGHWICTVERRSSSNLQRKFAARD